MSKTWEQILFTIALAGFGWLLFWQNSKNSQSTTNTSQYGGRTQPLFMSLNQIDLGFALPPGAASDVPLDQSQVGAPYDYVPDNNYVPF